MANLDVEDAEGSAGFYQKAVIGLTVCLGILGLYTIYTVFTTDIEWGFKINWNCFVSPLFPVLAVIGFFLQFFNWQHMSMESWIGTKGPNDSNWKWERNNDIIESMFGGCLVPILSHLLIIPCLYGAIMWYAIMGLVHMLGKLSPFFITALIAAVVFFYYRWASGYYAHKYRVAMLIGLTAVAAALFAATAYFMTHPNTISATSEKSVSSIGSCQITGNGVNLRKGPGTNYDKLGVMVSSGEYYPLLAESGDWVKIDYNGTEAWLSSKFCTLIYGGGMDDDDSECPTVDEEVSSYVGDELSATSKETDECNVADEVEPRAAISTVEVEERPQEIPEVKEEIAEVIQTASAVDNTVHTSVDQMAEFPGGMPALMKWLGTHIHYPESAQRNNVQGRVVVKFIVEKDGSITNPQIMKSVDNELDREALRVVGNMPKWTPGKSGNVPVRSYFSLPVNFRLREE